MAFNVVNLSNDLCRRGVLAIILQSPFMHLSLSTCIYARGNSMRCSSVVFWKSCLYPTTSNSLTHSSSNFDSSYVNNLIIEIHISPSNFSIHAILLRSHLLASHSLKFWTKTFFLFLLYQLTIQKNSFFKQNEIDFDHENSNECKFFGQILKVFKFFYIIRKIVNLIKIFCSSNNSSDIFLHQFQNQLKDEIVIG